MATDLPIYDFAIIGAGIAGASAGAQLAGDASVVMLEGESQPGYHATGRSAALYVPAYGPPVIRMLTRASAAFFHHPPAGFSEEALLSPREILMIGTQEQSQQIADFVDDMEAAAAIRLIDHLDVLKRQPLLREGYAAYGVVDSSGSDIDVNALHRGFLRDFKSKGGELKTSFLIEDITHHHGQWHLRTKDAIIKARTIINAAGAWAGTIGKMAGAEDIGLVAKRRTAVMVDAPAGIDLSSMPMTIDIEEQFYLKPEAGQLLISPANEDPMPPCDVQPEELDIAICIDRIERAFDIKVKRPKSSWAGLRSFVCDKEPVVGYSEMVDGFFWLAGQGGYGMQSSPAIGRLAASLLQGGDVPDDIAEQGVTAAMVSPSRLL